MLPLSYRLEKAGIEPRRKDYASDWRTFGNTLVSCIRDGRYTISTADGQWQVVTDQAFLVPAGLRHKVATRGKAAHAHYYHLHCRVYELHGLFPQLDRPIVFPMDVSRKIGEWHHELLSLQQEGDGVGPSVKVSEILAKTVGLAVEHCPEISAMWEAPLRIRLLPVLKYIQENLSADLRREDLADVLGVSVPHLHTLFVSAFNVSPMDKVFSERMQHARQMLHWSTLPVASVGRQCGFADPFYFSRAFKRAEGVSPSQYRKARQLD